MKKEILFLMLITFLNSFSQEYSSTQEYYKKSLGVRNKAKSHTLSIYPFAFISSTFLLGYENRIAETNKSIKALLGITSAENLRYYHSNMYNTFEIYTELQPRFYLGDSSNAMKGFYIAPTIGYKYFQFSEKDSYIVFKDNISTKMEDLIEFYANSANFGILFGVQFALAKYLFFDWYLGGKIQHSWGNAYREINTFPNYYDRGVGVQLGFSVGGNF